MGEGFAAQFDCTSETNTVLYVKIRVLSCARCP